MKKCETCGRPLSDFEVRFHSEAGSPSSVSEKCFDCSKASEAFEGADIENKGHKKQISFCVIGILLCIAVFLPLFPYLNSYELPLLMELYSGAAVVLCVLIGAVAFHPTFQRFLSRHKESGLRTDPPVERYGTCYSPVKTSYEIKEKYDGVFTVNKLTSGGASQVDRWEWRSTGNEKIDGIAGAYGSLIEKIIYIMAYAFFGASFIFWVLPYIAYAIYKDRKSAAIRANIPEGLQKAYAVSHAAAKPMPLTYHDKVGFLISREGCKKAPAAPAGNAFLKNFKEEEKKAARLPFFFKRYGNTAYMIVDYKECGLVGVTFVLVKEGKMPIEKRVVVARRFADTDPAAWESEWTALGVSSQVKYNMAWYEEKMTALLKDSRKEILGE